MEPAYICTACGIQFPPSDRTPDRCPICSDYRQFLPGGRQRWTTLEELRRDHRNAFQQLEPDLIGFTTTPEFAIGQRALIVRTPAGNVLWDCIALLDDATIEIINGLGGLRSIAISHPHYYTTMVEWGRAFNAQVLVHDADRQWAVRSDHVITFWTGESYDVLPGVRLVRCGGHFAGSAILHWEARDGRGVLLTGDTLQVVADTHCVSFMRSYPNMIPLPDFEVARIARVAAALEFDRIYGAFWGRDVRADGAAAVQRSAERYISWVRGEGVDARD